MSQITRRDAIKGIVVGGTGLAVTSLSASQGERTTVMANDQQTSEIAQAARAFRGQHQLTYNVYNGEVHNYWAWDHMHNAPMGRPLLVLDMYEHAYHLDYGAAAAKYVDAFMQK